MDVGFVIGCVVSAMAGTGIGVVTAGMLAAGKHDDLQRQLARLSDDDARRRDEVARLNAELTRFQMRDAAAPRHAAIG